MLPNRQPDSRKHQKSGISPAGRAKLAAVAKTAANPAAPKKSANPEKKKSKA